MIVSGEEESAEKAMRDKDGVTPTTSFLHVTVECLKECGDSVKHISSTEKRHTILIQSHLAIEHAITDTITSN